MENVDNPWEQWKPEWSITDLVISTALHRELPKMNGVPEQAGKRDAGYPAKPGMGGLLTAGHRWRGQSEHRKLRPGRVAAGCISFASGQWPKAHSFRRGSFPKATRFAGLALGHRLRRCAGRPGPVRDNPDGGGAPYSRAQMARAVWTPEAPAWARPRVTPAPSPAAKKPGRAVSSSGVSWRRAE